MKALKHFLMSPAAVLGLLLLIGIVGLAVFADLLYPRDPLGLAGRPLQWPNPAGRFLLGTDASGRDIAAQIAHGARTTLLMGVVSTLIAIAIGIVVGAVAGFYGGLTDD